MIRPMRRQDLPEILRIEKQIFTAPWNERAYREELENNPFAQLLVYEKDGRICGSCDLWILYEQAQIATLGVRPECQHQGIGQGLLSEMLRRAEAAGCETCSLEVRPSNAPALALYEKNGFIKAAVRKAYYSDNHEDAWLMIRPLGGKQDDSTAGTGNQL